ncbi:MAG: YkgJ family cysteine cluster protein [Verrucomicrobiaceae bacterium]|nr:YkgJ family cysteine cluster protein [Verrucomicrobiaceae bacterium]
MEEGMRYVCQRCGNCCRWPGEVPLSDAELDRIADFLGMSLHDFIAEYTDLRLNRNGLTLIEKPNHECIFLDGIDCRIQAVKPDQCAGFPNQWNFPGWRKSCEAVPVPDDTVSGAGRSSGDPVPSPTRPGDSA